MNNFSTNMGIETVDKMIKRNLGLEGNEDFSWALGDSSLGGRGVFAKRDIPAGEIIFTDVPLILGPRPRGPMSCVECLMTGVNLEECPDGCGLPLCQKDTHRKEECSKLRKLLNENSLKRQEGWREKLFWSLTPFRGLALSPEEKDLLKSLQCNDGPQHGHEVHMFKDAIGGLNKDEELWMNFICKVLDAVAFEVDTGFGSARGLYPLGGMLNHSCCPNVRHYFHLKNLSPHDSRIYVMSMVASVDIKCGEELLNYYCPLLWGTPARRHYLFQTKHFYCKCSRCADPTEFGTYFSSLKCICAKGHLMPNDPLDFGSKWSCDSCEGFLSAKDATIIQARLSKTMGEGKTNIVDTEFCQSSVQLALHSIWKMGLKPQRLEDGKFLMELQNAKEEETTPLHQLWNKEDLKPPRVITDEDLKKHENKIRNILDLIQKLRLGMCRMRGLLLYQFYLTQEEWKRREKEVNNQECQTALKEALQVLEYDIAAPGGILQLINMK